MSAEFSRPPVMEASLEDPIDEPRLLDRVQNVAADARVKLSRLAGAGLLVLGGTTADLVTAYGDADDHSLVGDWNADGTDTLGIRQVDQP